MTPDIDGNQRCPVCYGISPPHPEDLYHKFLNQLLMSNEHLLKAKEISKMFPSIITDLDKQIELMKQLIHLARIM